MPEVTLTPVSGDPWNGGAQPVDPSVVPPVRVTVPDPAPPATTRAPQPSDLVGSGNALHRWDEMPAGSTPASAVLPSFSTVNNMVRAAANAVPIVGAWADKADAATDAALHGGSYADALAAQQRQDADFAQANPVKAGLAGFGGAVIGAAPLIAAAPAAFGIGSGPLLGRAAASVASNAALSGADAAVRGEDVGHAAALGGTLGLLGPAAEGVARAKFDPNTVGMFLGAAAAHADLARMTEAESLLRAGFDPDTVRRLRDWFRGADGEMRYEISDHAARLSDDAFHPSANGARLGDVLHHPELFKAYPDLADVRFTNVPPPDEEWSMGSYLAPYGGDPGELFINPVYGRDEGLRTALHEVQHAVQEREGFNPGASPKGLATLLAQQRRRIIDTKRMSTLLRSGVRPEDAQSAFVSSHGYAPHPDALDAAQHLTPQEIDRLTVDADDAYHRNMGEVEARNTENRSAMTPSQRDLSPPWATQDVPDHMQLEETGGVGGRPSTPAPDPLAAVNSVEGGGVHLRALPVDGLKSTAPEPAAVIQKWIDNDLRLNGTLHLTSVGLAAGQGASRAYAAAHDAATVRAAPGNRASPFDLRGPVVPDGLLPSLLGDAAHQRDAERAVLPHIRSASASDATPHRPAMTASLDLDHSGLREAIHHVRALKAELASLGTASVSVHHSGFGTRGDHASGAVRSALNGNFGSDGRAFT